jgi:long-chain acyl-CoA synthetase
LVYAGVRHSSSRIAPVSEEIVRGSGSTVATAPGAGAARSGSGPLERIEQLSWRVVRCFVDAPRKAMRGRAVHEGEDAVFLTGATGFLGMELLARYLEQTDRRIYALVRGADADEAQRRLQQTLLELFGPFHRYADRVVAIRGDVTQVGMGIASSTDLLAEQVSEIVHCAAAVSFEQPLEQARSINVDGTRRVLEFAERCKARGGLRRVSYISTAFVAGRSSGCFSEDDLDRGQSFRNSYEQSKFEAECLVNRSRNELPITVFRPSIIVGEQRSGWTGSFNVLYWPLRMFSRGSYVALPGRHEAPVDVVPVDYVADAVFALSQIPQAEGTTFHLTAGTQASSVGEVLELATRFFRRREPRLVDPSVYDRVIHPILLKGTQDERVRRALRRSEVYFPYFAMQVGFDDRRARIALRGAGIATPPLESYFDRLVRFAVASQWGRRRITRATAMGRTTGHSQQTPAARDQGFAAAPDTSLAVLLQ